MKTILLAVMLTVLFASAAFAEVQIIGNDPGGEVHAYIAKYDAIERSGNKVVIDGACMSACTLVTGIVPRGRVCVTERAALVFHAASYYDEEARSFVPTRKGTEVVMNLYPPAIRAWIRKHGGLTSRLIWLRGRELQRFYRLCK